jgi:UDP-N-acetylmuramoylalanine--D-glutamate ligase
VIISDAFRGKRYAVLGLARSGLATVRSLLASGAEVTAWDSKEEARNNLGTVPKLLFGDPMEIDLAGFDGVVVSPGVPLNSHPIAQKARDAQVPVIGDIELFALARPSLPAHKVVGITGTNGKSTVTALIHHILETASVPTLMGGNIGLPILSQEPLPEGGVYVLELSSFQIDLTHNLDCDVALLTNVTPDHLDRYDDFSAYMRAKARLFEMQSADHIAIWDSDEPGVRELVDLFDDGILELKGHGNPWTPDPQWVEKHVGPGLPGPHNLANAKLAAAAACAFGLQYGNEDKMEQALQSFPGLAHRMERVGEVNGVLYVNDSKATNPTSTAPALAAYPDIHWILGGVAKTNDLDACMPHLSNVRAAYSYGQDGPMLAGLLRPHITVVESETLEEAVSYAHDAARPGETVILSPACASYDQFRDFEDRGDAFRRAVMALAPIGAA